MLAYQHIINRYTREHLAFPSVCEIEAEINESEHTDVGHEDRMFLEYASDIEDYIVRDEMLLECFLTYRDNFSEVEKAYLGKSPLISKPKEGEW